MWNECMMSWNQIVLPELRQKFIPLNGSFCILDNLAIWKRFKASMSIGSGGRLQQRRSAVIAEPPCSIAVPSSGTDIGWTILNCNVMKCVFMIQQEIIWIHLVVGMVTVRMCSSLREGAGEVAQGGHHPPSGCGLGYRVLLSSGPVWNNTFKRIWPAPNWQSSCQRFF